MSYSDQSSDIDAPPNTGDLSQLCCSRYSQLHMSHRRSMDLIEKPISATSSMRKSQSLPIIIPPTMQLQIDERNDVLHRSSDLIVMASPRLQKMVTSITNYSVDNHSNPTLNRNKNKNKCGSFLRMLLCCA
jgi:hypothetical protein